MLSFGYIVSIFLGYFVLNEPITIRKVMGIVIIIGGIIILSKAGLEQKHD
jgi:drug/metabolite transporter (DMT)-like permease